MVEQVRNVKRKWELIFIVLAVNSILTPLLFLAEFEIRSHMSPGSRQRLPIENLAQYNAHDHEGVRVHHPASANPPPVPLPPPANLETVAQDLAEDRPDYFIPVDEFRAKFREQVFEGALLEEIYARWPLWFFMAVFFDKLKHHDRLKLILTAFALTIPTIYWVGLLEVASYPISASLFCAGVGWGILVVKTRSFWPAVVAHTCANTLIYFALKSNAYLHFFPT